LKCDANIRLANRGRKDKLDVPTAPSYGNIDINTFCGDATPSSLGKNSE
jgi:hypothetical protein